MKKIATLSLVIVLGFTLAYAVTASAWGRGMGWGGGWGGHRMAPGYHMNYDGSGDYRGAGYCPGWGGGYGPGYDQGNGRGYYGPNSGPGYGPGWQRPTTPAPPQQDAPLPANPIR